MHYKFLTEVGHHYATETTEHLPHNTVGAGQLGVSQPLRRVALLGLAAAVLKAKTAYERLQQKAAGIHGTKVSAGIKASASFFVQAAKAQAPSAAADRVTAEMLNTAKAEYEKQLRHFQNQGGVLTPEGTLDWGASDSLVIYDSDAASKDLTKLRFRNRLLYTDDACTVPFDTSNLSTFFSKLGFAIYVMSEEGNIHAANHAIGKKHHSSLLAAANAAGAGEMKVEKGRLVWISNKSGHYTPSTPHFIQTLHQLQKMSIDLSAVHVQFHTAAGKSEFNTVADLLAFLKPEDDYYHAKMIAYVNSYPYDQIDRLITANGRAFPSAPEYHAGDKKGLVVAATRQVVSHKLVCQFFKAHGLSCNPMVNLSLLQSGATR
jgi:hypothetical protein